jgi:hypothetical protein
MRKRHRLTANAILVTFIVANMLSSAWLLKLDYDPYHREDFLAAAKFINNNFNDNDGLIGYRNEIQFYLKKDFPTDGEVLWEVYLGNPDMKINRQHWLGSEVSLNRKVSLLKRFGDLVWVARYEKQDSRKQ